MLGIIGIVAFLTVLSLSLLITRLATVALTLTGLSHEASQFQARSTFTGTGFTTSEAEEVMNHPVRRRIIMMLMLFRSAGIITIVLSLIRSFIGSQDLDRLVRLYWLVGGAVTLWLISLNRYTDRVMRHLIEWGLRRWTDLDVRDYGKLLKLSGDYVIHEWHIETDDWVAQKALSACRLRSEGVMVVGIYRRNGTYIGVPSGDTTIRAGDRLVLYGRTDDLRQLSRRKSGPSGDVSHDEAVKAQKRHKTLQDNADTLSDQDEDVSR